MFEDDLLSKYLNKYSSTTTTSEESSQTTQDQYSPQTDYNANSGMSFDYDQDYSSKQNFTEQTSYDSVSMNVMEDEPEQSIMQIPSLNAPLIQKEEQAVNLVKKRTKIVFEARMKTIIAVFSVIVFCLMFVTIFNFIEANRIESQFASKQIEINNLQESISNSKLTYTLVSDDEYLKEWAGDNGFVDATEENTVVVNIGEFYEQEPDIEDIPSNWFNDVCEFFSRLFA